MRPYTRSIIEATNCAEQDAPRIQVLMRWELDTLDALSPSVFDEEALIAAELLAHLRDHSELDDEHGGMAKKMLAQIDLEARACA